MPPEVASELVAPTVHPATLQAIAAFDPVKAALAELVKEHKGVIYDLTVTKDNESARAVRAKFVKIRSATDAAYASWNQPILAAQDAARAFVKNIKTEVFALEEPLDADIKADEARREKIKQDKADAEAKRVAAIRTRIGSITGLPFTLVAATVAELTINIDALTAAEITTEIFAEFVLEANDVRNAAIAALTTLRTAAETREAQAIALEAQRVENERVAAVNADLAKKALAEQQATALKLQEQQAADTIERQRAADKQAADDQAARDKVVADGIEGARLLRIQTDAFESEKALALQKLADAAKELDDRRVAHERMVEDARIAALPPEPAPLPAIEAAPTAVADAPIVDAIVVAERTFAPLPAVARPDAATLVRFIATSYSVDTATALDWIEDFDLFELRAAVQDGAL